MEGILSFDQFRLNENLSIEEIEKALIEKGAFKNDDGTWSVGEDTHNFRLNEIPGIVKDGRLVVTFKETVNNFDCRDLGLTTLEGTPRKVGGAFYCEWNPLTSLIGGPLVAVKSYNAQNCNLTSLEGMPEEIPDGDVWVDGNQLTDLKGGPKKVNGSYNASDNKLTSLEGGPEYCKFSLSVRDNQLTDFRGWPKGLRSVDAFDNPITSLEGCPEEVHMLTVSDDGILKTYYGGPKKFTGRRGIGGEKSAVPEIEKEWYYKVIGKGKENGDGIGYDNYYIDLYKYIMNKAGNMVKGIEWKNFDVNDLPDLNLKNIILSEKGLDKFNI
jgi:hypothetical protein